MNICPKFNGFCDTFGKVQCGGDCAKCKDKATANAMTLGELERNYRQFADESGAARPNTVRVALNALHRVMIALKLTEADSMAKIDRAAVQQFYNQARELAPVSRKGAVEALQMLSSERFCEWATARGMAVVKMPSSKGLNGRYERYSQISATSMRAVRDLQWEYRQSEDPRKWLILTLALDFGMSKADVMRAKWRDLFVQENGVTLVSYCRNKTGKRAMWKVSDDLRREFVRAEKLARALSVRSMRKDTVESVLRIADADKGKVVQSEIWDAVNADLRRVVSEWANDSKALHNCRKEFCTKVCRGHGWEVAEIASGDTIKMLQKSYVGKLVVDWAKI